MEEFFQPQSLCIEALFINKDSIYRIPKYQRPYRWEDEQVEQLWDDIYTAFVNEEKNYFLGSIITVERYDNNTTTYEVVDGQQRLTTLIILLCVVRDIFCSPNAAESAIENGISKKAIENCIQDYGANERLKFSTHSHHQSDFEKYILNTRAPDKLEEKPTQNDIKKDAEPKYKFINTRYILFNKLEELKKERKVGAFINFLFNQVKVIRIVCKDKYFAIKLFQVLNTRGIDLTTSDLIKSFLLEQLHNEYKDKLPIFEDKERSFMDDWRSIEQTIIDCDITLDDLFIIYAYYSSGRKPKKSHYDELKNIFEKEKNPNETIMDIKAFIETYVDKIYENKDKVLYAFRYLAWNMHWKAVLLTALHKEYPDYDELKEQLRRFYYLYWLAGKTLPTIERTSFDIIRLLKEGKKIREIKDKLDAKIKSDNIIELARNNLISSQVVSQRWIKPLLLLIEYNATDDSKLSFISTKSKGALPLHLEHILPIGFKSEDWGNNITKQDADKWQNSVGNITLLSGRKNKQASNNPFKKKIKIYRGENNTRKEKKTAFSITQNIITDFDTNKYDKQWNIRSMRDRFKWFLAEVKEILKEDALVDDDIHEPKTV